MAQRVAARDEVREPLQALLLADSFTQRFRPITMERPKVLLPLVAVPMIEYTLEWLASAEVEEVFVFCCAHASQVTSYLEASRWMSLPHFKVTCIESQDSVSMGDALRYIYDKNVIRGDFVLVSGDTVSNMSLRRVLDEHKARLKKDKLAVMTMVIKRAKPSALTRQTRLGNEELVIALDPETKQLLHYDAAPRGRQHVALDRSLLSDRTNVELHVDMQDCHIDICSSEVLTLFTDNFDYQQMRRDFVRGLLSDEVMGNKVYTYEISEEYAARMDNLRAYDTVSKDVLHRWTHPFVPDIPLSDCQEPVLLDRSNKYREKGVAVSRTAMIGENTFLGHETWIGDRSSIKNSVIGRKCKIGNDVTIEGSYIWDDVTIKDGAHVHQSVICDGACVKEGAVLEPGVVLSFKVVISANITVPGYSKISCVPQPTEEDSSDEELEYATAGGAKEPDYAAERNGILADHSVVGPDGSGFKWFTDVEDDWKQSVASIPLDKIKELISDDGNADEVAQAVPDPVGTDIDGGSESGDDDFEKEVDETFRRGVNGVELKNVILEVNALKLAYNKEFSDCAGAIFKGIISVAQETPYSTPGELFEKVRAALGEWTELLKKFLTSVDDEIEILLNFEEICDADVKLAPMFSKIVTELYDKELVSEDAITSWASEKAGADESEKVYLNQCQALIQWLREASEEEDSATDEE